MWKGKRLFFESSQISFVSKVEKLCVCVVCFPVGICGVLNVLILFFFFHFFQPLRYVFRFFLSSVAGFFFPPCASVLSRNSDFKIGGSAVFVPKNFSALLTRDIGNIGNCIFFLRSKKKSNKWRRRRKKFRVRCKNLAFSAQSHTSNPFLRSKKGKIAPQAKKKN